MVKQLVTAANTLYIAIHEIILDIPNTRQIHINTILDLSLLVLSINLKPYVHVMSHLYSPFILYVQFILYSPSSVARKGN